MKRVLVVEDDSDIRELVQSKLQSAGFDVESMTDGSDLLARSKAAPPDLFILDVMLPGLSGLELCAALRHEPVTAGAPIILLTARAQGTDITLGLASGADEYILKPFSPRGLVDRVHTLLNRPDTVADDEG